MHRAKESLARATASNPASVADFIIDVNYNVIRLSFALLCVHLGAFAKARAFSAGDSGPYNYHFHPALELSGDGVAAPATGASESAFTAGCVGKGSSSVAQLERRSRIPRQAAQINRFIA